MRRLQLTAFGDAAKVVRLDSAPAPSLAADDLLVQMEAAPMNRSDFMLVEGKYGVRPEFPYNVGSEGVGRVIGTGRAASPLDGKRVLILPTYEQGTWAEQTVVSSRNVVEVSNSADPLQLAMIGINPATAYLLLKQYTHLMPSDWIGQTAANAAMGQYIVQLAKLAGLKTLNVVRRQEAADAVRAFGGDAAVLQGNDLKQQIEAALGSNRLSIAFDTLGGEPIGTLLQFVRDGGIGVGYGLQTGVFPKINPVDMYFRGLSFHGFWLIKWLRNAPRAEVQWTYQHLAALVAEGKLFAEVEQTYSLDQYQQALEHAQTTERGGKILFRF
ncbi:zinc-dependent alcohol dehydrogenase family protein [Acidipila sp. EB88]|uniref:zinc-dependent alcohol dehydrogenase family protein n=1 Tax=Acidipila sp. EB88 TaxID=2305226 RepID=UPI000F5F82C7|nr:zinc-dependent alcohol dehydrogenase family protein [Acidipila sp. EB88]RRA49856.1 trans-2-enoyl-CoA reductase [Acidipila sp. EB88]